VKKRLVLVFTFVVVNFGSGCSPAPTSNSIQGETPIILVKPELEKEKPNTPVEEVLENLEMVDESFNRIVFFLAKVVIILLSLVVVHRILLLIIFRTSELVINNFTNASGAEGMDFVLPGLSQLARQRLVQEMKGVHQRLKEHITVNGLRNYRPPDKLSLPQATPDERLSSLVASLNEFTPDQIDPLVNLLKIIFPAYGTKVTSILQSQGEDYNRLGITFEVIDIEGRFASKLYTIWEEKVTQTVTDTVDKTVIKTASETETDSEIELPIVEEEPNLKDRYRLLLKPASRWLALELSRREMLTNVPWYYLGNWCQRYQAQIHNFFGVINYASAPTHGSFFYQLAIEDLQAAIEFDPNWYQPYENLGDTYSTQGRDFQENKRVNRQRQAILQYEKALARCEDQIIRRRIKVGKAMAQLLTNDKIIIQEAQKEIQLLEKQWNAQSDLSPRFLYNLASWYAIFTAQNNGDEQTKQKARRYLVYALLRDSDRNLWDWASRDPDFQAVRERFTDFEYLLMKKLNEVPQLHEMTGERFVKHAEEILKEINWN
jgi:tetratricopeptide (TPR) repeat protein